MEKLEIFCKMFQHFLLQSSFAETWIRFKCKIVEKSLRLAEFLSSRAAALWKENTSAREIKDGGRAPSHRCVNLLLFKFKHRGCAFRFSSLYACVQNSTGERNQTNLPDQHLSMDADSRISSVWLENRAGKHKALSGVIHAAYSAQCNSNNNNVSPRLARFPHAPPAICFNANTNYGVD